MMDELIYDEDEDDEQEQYIIYKYIIIINFGGVNRRNYKLIN